MKNETPKKTRTPRGPYQVKGTSKQLAYLDGLVAGKSKCRAAHDAGYQGKPRRVIADLERSEFVQAISAAMEEQGITLQSCAAKLADLMETKQKKAFVTREGSVVYADAVPVHDTQLKATQAAMDLLGLTSKARIVGGEQKRPASDGVNILLLAQRYEHLSDEQLEEAMQLMRVGQFEGSALAEKSVEEKTAAFTVDGKERAG